ncbi:MAG: hypothetical protein M1832_003171 [Thelocarpon impressellum]|nr:MAG: hypothetical protein M1832_003171 [Thelocarpon impressellum]
MIKKADEIPVTYLNKGQAYSLSIVDTARAAAPPPPGPVRYRTFVRVSFEDEQQRQRPAACWQLWKEGRGTNEAHQRGGRLQAVECVDPPSPTGDAEAGQAKVELESASFDGFSVDWTAAPAGPAECSVAVRFNFLSTDFSHSKGVKGIPVRLCAKTELVSGDAAPAPAPELCYCKVKLFRDHGAERKLSNDVAHVRKTIDKLQQQIAQAESGVKDFRKRKRSGSTAAKPAPSRPGKVLKHKRTWSMSSASSGGGRSPAEEDLHQKLATVQDMFSSTRPASVLYLRGSDQDDPDLHPVHLQGEPSDLTKVVFAEDGGARFRTSGASLTTDLSSLVSPASSSSGAAPLPLQASPQKAEWAGFQPVVQADLQSNPQHLASPPDQAVKVPKQRPQQAPHVDDGGSLSNWIEALGVDASYRPPPDRVKSKPVACLYVLPKGAGSLAEKGCYRAVYLMQRTVQDLVHGIAAKVGVEPARIVRTVHVNGKGLNIMMDDDVVRQLPEGQDMVLELAEVTEAGTVKTEWTDAPNPQAAGFEVKLIF